jgi:hypothetical protein
MNEMGILERMMIKRFGPPVDFKKWLARLRMEP